MKYYKTQGELIDSYESIHGATVRVFRRQLMNSMMTHAYELGYKHATEEEQPNPAEFDSNYEQETSNE